MILGDKRVSTFSTSTTLDVNTPRHSLLSARFKQSFAYIALQSRMPGIMHQVILTLTSFQSELVEMYGEGVRKDIMSIVDNIERLKMELLRDRKFKQFTGNAPDKNDWNAFLRELPHPKCTYFRASWLHSECYLYRRICSFFENSTYLKNFDYFAELKQEDLKISGRAIMCLTEATRDLGKNFKAFSQLMRINLWSNHYEIQLNAFVFHTPDESSNIDVLAHVADLDKNLLVDDSVHVWNCLMKAKGQETILVDYICDNAGFELFTDMLFIEYLLDNGLATQVRLHVKAIPWYISDVMEHDVYWTINYLMSSQRSVISDLGNKLNHLMAEKRIIISPKTYFWTGPHAYFVMVDSNLDLYKSLSESQVAIFKGDLNYRKLLGDYIWDSTEEFITCLRGFRPTNICAMRTVKCEVVCGMAEGAADNLLKVEPTWMISGSYGVIQYTDSLKCKCDKSPSDHLTKSGNTEKRSTLNTCARPQSRRESDESKPSARSFLY